MEHPELRFCDRRHRPSLPQAAEAAERVLQEAAARARALCEHSRAEIEQLKQEARRLGREEGRAEAARLLLSDTDRCRAVIDQERSRLLEVVLAVSEEVVGEALALQPESICSRISRALDYARSCRRISIRVSSADLPLVRGRLAALERSIARDAGIEVRADDSLSAGDAILETELGTIEAEVRSHLRALAAHLRSLERVGQSPVAGAGHVD